MARNIKDLQHRANVKRSGRGVGLAIYDTQVAPAVDKTCQLALHLTQMLGLRTVKCHIYEQAMRTVMFGEKIPEEMLLAAKHRKASLEDGE